ncbi:MAG: 23S rRNA (adenine(2503)-C(2))-methyltransferase RlmN, partial [Bacteroidetes bacterium]|nr:23S rRNA (adenine(2503)-C(2))-methyltransferase RlmN [Bacteroidota bacterium]
MKKKLFGKTLSQLQGITTSLGLPKFTARQIADWLYKKDITSIDEMSNLSKDARQKLNESFVIGLQAPSTVQTSKDGTKKYLFSVEGHGSVESAYIPEANRSTLCVSSQVGCKMRCLFCMTGRQGLKSNLTAGEILNQVRSLPEWHELTNIVYMGMGEP